MSGKKAIKRSEHNDSVRKRVREQRQTPVVEMVAYERAIIPTPPVPGTDLYEAHAWHAATNKNLEG